MALLTWRVTMLTLATAVSASSCQTLDNLRTPQISHSSPTFGRNTPNSAIDRIRQEIRADRVYEAAEIYASTAFLVGSDRSSALSLFNLETSKKLRDKILERVKNTRSQIEIRSTLRFLDRIKSDNIIYNNNNIAVEIKNLILSKNLSNDIDMTASNYVFNPPEFNYYELDNIDHLSSLTRRSLDILKNFPSDQEEIGAVAKAYIKIPDDSSLKHEIEAAAPTFKPWPFARTYSHFATAFPALAKTAEPAQASGAIEYPSGPFGFTWGQGPDKAPTQPIRRVNFRADNVADRSAGYCVDASYSSARPTPESWKLSYNQPNIDPSIRSSIDSNSSKFDSSMNGVVAGYIHKIPIVGKDMEVCAVYINNALFQITIETHQYDSTQSSLIVDAINQKYGNRPPTCRSGICTTSWNDNTSRVHIQIISSEVGGLKYVYAPAKLEQMTLWAQFYKQAADSLSKGTKF